MTQEDKQLLLTDLCGRLPYGIKGLALGSREDTISVLRLGEYPSVKTASGLACHLGREQFKPYLRPMSLMTEEEKDKYSSFVLREHDGYLTDGMPDYTDKHYVYIDNVNIFIDWLNAHHFDYRGLIPKGLALEAPEDMYKEEQQ